MRMFHHEMYLPNRKLYDIYSIFIICHDPSHNSCTHQQFSTHLRNNITFLTSYFTTSMLNSYHYNQYLCWQSSSDHPMELLTICTINLYLFIFEKILREFPLL